MFGATDCAPEPTTTLFADGLPDGTVHSVRMADRDTGNARQPRSLCSPRERRCGTQLPSCARSRRGKSAASFATIYESNVVVPYGQGPQDMNSCAAAVRPVHAQTVPRRVRAERRRRCRPARASSELDGIVHDPIFADGFE
jgi:hypothetical protein